MTVNYWRLNGTSLKMDGITLACTVSNMNRSHRQSETPVHGGDAYRESAGRDLPSKTIEFTILGAGSSKWEMLQDILDIVDSDNDDVWTLEAPDDGGLKVYGRFRRAAFSTKAVHHDDEQALGKITLRIDAIVNGVWISDGGDFAQLLWGSFTKTATGWTDQDGVPYTSLPLVEVQQQAGSYPLARRASDYKLSQPAFSSTRSITNEDGANIYYTSYDMTGFLVPTPSATGDVGVWEMFVSPSRPFLGGGEDDGGVGGVAVAAVASRSVGSY